MKYSKILNFIFLLCFILASTGYSTTEKYWKKVEEAEQNGLPKTAIENLNKILEVTQKQKKYGEWLNALAEKIVLEATIQGNKPEEKVKRLKKEFASADSNTIPLLQAILAQWYWHYYEYNSWSFMRRTPTERFSEEDFTTWDLKKIFGEIDSLYQDILKEKELLVSIPVEKFNDFLEMGSMPVKLRPTLYDFIAHEALTFYTSVEQAAALPEDAFEIDANSDAFSPATKFLTYKPMTVDTLSPKFKAIRLYQSLLDFHLKNNNAEAFVDLEIQRLRYIKNVAFGEEKNRIYIKRLTELIKQYHSVSLISMAAYYLAKAWAEEDNFVKAYEIAQSGYKKFSHSPGGKYCDAYMAQLTAKLIKLRGEKCIPPKPYRMHITYKNFTTLYFKIFQDHWDAFMDEKNRRPNQLDTLEIRKLLSQKPYKEWQIELPATDDLKENSIEIDLPELTPGYYRIFASWQPDFYKSTMVKHTWLWVSNLTLVTRTRPGMIDGLILDAITGEPIGGVKVTQIIWDYNNKRYKYGDTTHTNADGFFEFKRCRAALLYIKKGNDELLESNIRSSGYHSTYKPDNETFFFTDRSLYRPGQTIYFKGICVHIDWVGDSYKVIPDYEVWVHFCDANGQLISRGTFKTNEFGSFSGHFTAPANRLTGRMTIKTDDPSGSTSFRVEEYKRPKFTVEIESPKEAVKLNQQIKVTGRAFAYTGAPVDNAFVRFYVERDARCPYWCDWYFPYQYYSRQRTVISHGRTKTDSEGIFTITFYAKPDPKISPDAEPTFTYTIHADVTSPDGETRSDDATVVLGYSELAAKLSTEDQPQNNKEFSILVTTQTLDGSNISAKAKLQIYRLKEPLKPKPAKILEDELIRYDNLSKEDDKEQFSSNWETWPKERLVYETDVSTKHENPKSLELKLPTGLYKLECYATDKFSKEVRGFLPIMVLPDWDEKRFSIKLPSVTKVNNEIVEVGKNLEVLWGTGYKTGRCFIEIEHNNKIIKRYWTNKNQTMHTFSFPVTGKFRGGFTVHLTQVSENRAYIKDFPICVPWDNKVFSISFETFRNKLQPGQKENITLKIKGKKKYISAAEMVATMYDFSLDQFYPHYWSRFNFFRRDYSLTRSRFINSVQWFRDWKDSWNDFKPFPFINYIHFPGYVIKDYLYYQFPDSGIATYSKCKNYGKLIGTVIDAQTGEPLPFVNVFILGTTLGAVTNLDGQFFILNVPEGTYSVQALGRGINTSTVTNVKSIKGKTSTINFKLGRTILGISGLTIMGKDIVTGGFSTEYGEVLYLVNGMSVEDEVTRIPRKGEDKVPSIDLKDIRIRRNLNETAFFYPHLKVRLDGTVRIQFTCPEALTKWKFMGFLHGKKCESGSIVEYAVTQKELMVQPNPPRFLREGDTLYFTAKVINMSDKHQKGKVQLDFKDLITEKPMNKPLGLTNNVQIFEIKVHTSETFSWKIRIPKGMNPLSYTVVAKSKTLSDGETGAIPVLSSRIFLTESFPLYVRGPQTKRFTFDRLKEMDKSKTLEPYKFTLQMTSNPSWYAIQALPYLIKFPFECSEQIFNRLYANCLAQHIANSNPKIREIFNQWRGTGALKSNLEKNEELKSVLLTETPWVIQAQSESQAKRNVGILFEENTLNNNLNSSFTKLKNKQLSDGSWPWFPGGRSDSYITLYIMTGFGRLRHLGVETDVALALRSLDYLDSWIKDVYDDIKDKSKNHLSPKIAFYLYGRSFFLKEKPISPAHKKAVNYFLGQAEQYWLKLNSKLSQGYLALALNRFGRNETAKKIMASIKERSVQNEEMGMFWRETERSWWWYRAPIETQALMIEAFLEVMNDTTAAEECKVWLLKQKQTQNWKTTKATADAVYALILRGVEYLSSTKLVRVKLGETEVTPEKIEAGTGFYEKMYLKKEIEPQFSNISVIKEDKGIAWGGAYFQYFEEMSVVTSHTTNLQLDKKLFVNRETKKGRIIEPVTGPLNVGDLVTVRIVLRVDRDMEYVHLKDLRGSGLEPVDVLSRYRYQDGLRYYQSTKDVATHFFIDYLPKGTYVFEYELRVQHKGQYQSGIAEIQCMYAPEFSSHSQSQLLKVK